MMAEMRQILGDIDMEMIAELAPLFVDDFPPQLAAAERAIAASDAVRLKEIAHTLKGSSGSMGIKRFSELCYDLEMVARSSQLQHASSKMAQIRAEYQAACEALQDFLAP